jgi:hypothetical protein
MTAAQAAGPRICGVYRAIAVHLIRTDEARALRWEHVDIGNPDSEPPRDPERRFDGGVGICAAERRCQDDAGPRRSCGAR